MIPNQTPTTEITTLNMFALILSRRLCNPALPHNPSTTPPPPLREETDILVLNGAISKNTSPSSINVVTCFVLRPSCNHKTNLFQGVLCGFGFCCCCCFLYFSRYLVFLKTMDIFHSAIIKLLFKAEKTTHQNISVAAFFFPLDTNFSFAYKKIEPEYLLKMCGIW